MSSNLSCVTTTPSSTVSEILPHFTVYEAGYDLEKSFVF